MIIERTAKLNYGDELREVNLMFKEVSKDIAKKIIIENHYSRKWQGYFGLFNMGVFLKEEPNNCLGVASFGSMMNANSYKSISDDIEKDQIIELNRLWVDDVLGGNVETILLKYSFRVLKERGYKLVQSFADGRLGAGTIYKAANFRYYGYTKTLFFERISNGETIHHVLFEDTRVPNTITRLNSELINGEFKPFEVKTYRYIYILDKRTKVKLQEQPYPPYDKGIEYVDLKGEIKPTIIARTYILSHILSLPYEKQFIDYLQKNVKDYIEVLYKVITTNKTLDKIVKEKGVIVMERYMNAVDKLKSREVPIVNYEPPFKQYNIFDFIKGE